jgi:cytochrome c oxidase cbb3-type subunit 2
VKRAKFIALIAGFGFISLAIGVQALLPALMKETRIADVIKTVRTPLGELTEVKAGSLPYTERENRGRQIFIREGCWYCHSMYVRPTAGEKRRWGPISEVGEYAFDIPHTFGTRRIGPDLSRVGGKYGDDWHVAHFFNPRMVVPDSIMPKFTWLFGTEGDEYVPNDDGNAIIAFVQKLGMNKGKWRDIFGYQIASSGSSSIKTRESIENGKRVYEKRCVGCHGEKGDGKGPAARFLVTVKPRDFTSGIYKFRTTPTGSLPLDPDIYRTITIGVRGTAMPPWYMLPEQERWDIVHYIKTFSADFKDFPPDPPVYVPAAPRPDEDMLVRGKELYLKFKCWECHGHEGRGDGPAADALDDDFGEKILPTNFTKGIFKVGPRPEDIFRTVMTGLNGTPMPSYLDFMPEEETAWALSYYVLSFSADSKKNDE